MGAKAVQKTAETFTFPAPMVGIDSISPAMAMKPDAAIYLHNLVPDALGLRVRGGTQEVSIGLTGGIDNSVRTLIGYGGGSKNGAGGKLFAVTSTGIYDCTSPPVATALAAGNASPLPLATLNVLTTLGFPAAGTVYVQTDVGFQAVTYAGLTGASFTGCAGGTGVIAIGNPVVKSLPVQLIAFPQIAGDAGYGIWHAFSAPGGRYLVYCDEVNGAYLYTEATASWAAMTAGVAAFWALNIVVFVGTRVVNGGNIYTCTVGGITALAGGGPTGTTPGLPIVDNTATWNYVGPSVAGVIGPSVKDQNNGLTGFPTNFVFITSWGSRPWFVERDTSRAWYLPLNAIAGEANSVDFGVKMPHGGPLTGIYGWSYDGGSGMTTMLVGINGNGDVIIYGGSDPASASTFKLVGNWFVGGIPYGRRIAVEFGGELLVLSLNGIVQMSKLITGSSIFDRGTYATQRVINYFSGLIQQWKGLPGWSVHIHPTDNALLITIPQPAGYAPLQLVMAFATKGWSDYRDIPMLSGTVWNGQFFFGTADGRVLVNAGYADEMKLSNPNVATPIKYSFLHAYQTAGTDDQKLVQMARLSIISGTSSPVLQATALFDYDVAEPADTSGIGGTDGWDVAQWDVGLWDGTAAQFQVVLGLVGMGRAVAVAVRGQTVTKTTYLGMSLTYEPGGLL